MPYIKQKDREDAAKGPKTPGELNYVITLACIAALEGKLTTQEFGIQIDNIANSYVTRLGMNYTNANAIVGALDCAGRELKRRVNDRFRRAQVHKLFSRLIASRDRFYEMKMVPYENSKIAENGDVYPADLVN